MDSFNNCKLPNYILKPPFRFVKKYEHIFITNAKGRWVRRTLLEVFCKEFKAYSQEYYKQAIINGKIKVNKKQVKPEYTICENDLIEHETIRYEPPCVAVNPEIVYEDDDYLVLNKPAYMTIHTGGGYFFNTVMGILKFVMGFNNELHVLHRIDKLTSGLLLLAKNRDLSVKYFESNNTQNGDIKKTYLARVHGNFKYDQHECNKPIYCVSYIEGIFQVCDGDEEELKQKKAKDSLTNFKKLWYDEETDTSLLECYPITGRTHQIRVHLSYLGYPIVNDIGYGGKFIGNFFIKLQFPQLLKDISHKRKREDSIEQQKSQSEKLEKQENKVEQQSQQQQIKVKQNEQQYVQNQKEEISNQQQQIKQIEEKNAEQANPLTKKQEIQQIIQIKSDKNQIMENKLADNKEIKKEEDEEEEKELITKKIKISQQKEKNIVQNDQLNPMTSKTTQNKQITIQDQSEDYCLIEDKEWNYADHPMEIFLHSYRYQYLNKTFETKMPYWCEKKLPN